MTSAETIKHYHHLLGEPPVPPGWSSGELVDTKASAFCSALIFGHDMPLDAHPLPSDRCMLCTFCQHCRDSWMSKDAGTLVYFAGLRSRGEPCRMITAYGNVAMKDKLLTFDEWGALKSDKVPRTDPRWETLLTSVCDALHWTCARNPESQQALLQSLRRCLLLSTCARFAFEIQCVST